MKPSYDHETLWLKAKLFLNRAMDEAPPGHLMSKHSGPPSPLSYWRRLPWLEFRLS